MNDYYIWLINQISLCDYDVDCYQILLEQLYLIEFRAVHPRDENRYQDGKWMRYKYDAKLNIPFRGPYVHDDNHEYCSVLEMMIALSIRMENEYLYDPVYGDRTSHWFWLMIETMGLASMDDENFDEAYFHEVVENFLDRDYKPNGEGGLFLTGNTTVDMRNLEIWTQMNRYIVEFLMEGY